MSNLINLGSFNSKNGKTAGLGFASGLDANSLIDTILSARTASVKEVKDNITLNGKKIDAISQLSTLLGTLKTTSDFLRGQTGVGTQDSDFFKHTAATVTSSTSTDASNYVSVTSQSGATINSYKVTDITTANAHVLRKDNFASTSASVVGGAGTFTAGTFTLRGASITLADGDSLSTIKAKVNAISTTSGVRADIIQVDSTHFSLLLKASETGVNNKVTEYDEAGDPAALTGTLLFGGATSVFKVQQTANDASFTIDGLAITRSTNVVSDAISGVTFSLLSDTGVDDPTLTVKIDHDTSIVTTGVNNFINAYNALKEFVSRQTELDSNGNFVQTAVLGDDSILRDVTKNLDAQFSSIVKGAASGDVKSLFDIGIDTATFPGDATTPKTDNILVIDQAKFSAAIAKNFDSFRKVFTTNFVASSADLGLYKSSNKATLNNYTVDINTSRAVGDQVRILDRTTGSLLFNADYSAGLITGKAGTTLEGLQLVYSGSGVSTINVSSTQGIADKAFNSLSALLQKDTGLIDTTTKSITDQDTQLQDNIDKENADIAVERQLLVDRFTQLETVVSQANSTLSFLDTQTATNNKN